MVQFFITGQRLQIGRAPVFERGGGERGGWRTGVKGRDVVTNRILLGLFRRRAVTKGVTGA